MQGFYEEADLFRVFRLSQAVAWLLHDDGLVHLFIQESVVNVSTLYLQLLRRNFCRKHLYDLILDHGSVQVVWDKITEGLL